MTLLMIPFRGGFGNPRRMYPYNMAPRAYAPRNREQYRLMTKRFLRACNERPSDGLCRPIEFGLRLIAKTHSGPSGHKKSPRYRMMTAGRQSIAAGKLDTSCQYAACKPMLSDWAAVRFASANESCQIAASAGNSNPTAYSDTLRSR